jgi:hypothetical protein
LKIKYPNIDFGASEIEYKLNPIKGNTSTIHTIQKIANNSNIPINNSNKLILGMGMDNMFQLPYWKEVEDFHKKVSEIYIVPRKLTQSEEDNTYVFTINDTGKKHRFEKILPWNIDKKIINKRFGIEKDSEGQYNKGTNIAELSEKITIELPNIIVIDKKIPSTSSSMLRHYLSLYNEPNKDEIRRNINKIIFGKNCTNDDMVIDELIKEYGELFSGTLSKPYKNYNTEFKEYKNNLTNNLTNNLNNNSSNSNNSNNSNNHVNTITAKLKQDGGKKIRKSKTSKKNKTSKKSKKGMKK